MLSPTFLRNLLCSMLFIPAALLSISASATDTDRFAHLHGQLNIAGGTAHIPVMKQAARAIMTANPDIRITIAGGGSGVGAQQAAKGLAEIGNTGRALKPAEAAQGLVSFPFAIDGVAVILNPTNPVKALSSQQVADIYAGKITNWQTLGGADKTINLFTRDEASGTRAVFVKKLLHNGSVVTKANVVPSNGAMKTAVARDPAAIGYSSVGYIDNTVVAPTLDGIHPSNEACANGHYPVVRKLYMNTKGEPQGLTRAFIDFIYSPQGAGYIRSSGYIPLAQQ
ncbi:phosphate ABC transporter substrate-binding protein [Shewanella sp. NFH-SH190041]|uniref:phosphate ABC transporter substrate-binding protein n=1 Tax=Shewanella sp. NFH-SH190041 TaxID=2950245 RepID=UPI0021C45ABF|nr:phosphate ABC transporter substrate-binding protein [Shewanella sp. NFH-SH190041]BDM64195.1 phosphate ABC transporter substrate-binding protein [Shewanella sp. NFH-SH190041]